MQINGGIERDRDLKVRCKVKFRCRSSINKRDKTKKWRNNYTYTAPHSTCSMLHYSLHAPMFHYTFPAPSLHPTSPALCCTTSHLQGLARISLRSVCLSPSVTSLESLPATRQLWASLTLRTSPGEGSLPKLPGVPACWPSQVGCHQAGGGGVPHPQDAINGAPHVQERDVCNFHGCLCSLLSVLCSLF